MKRKHQGFFAAMILVSVVTASVLYFFYGEGSENKPGMERLKMSYDQVAAPEQKDLNFMRKIEADTGALVFPGGPDQSPLNLLLFGYRQAERTERNDTVSESQAETVVRMAYVVSFVFSSGEKRFCKIDDHFYPEGATLPDGGTIEKIGLNAVYIQKNKVGEWISVTKKEEKKEDDKENEKTGKKTPQKGSKVNP